MENKSLHVLVIAHPDDECMFFVPTLKALRSAGEIVWILCLTTGDYDGLGEIRTKEILRAGHLLQADRVLVRDNLKDHPSKRWKVPKVQKEIQEALASGTTADKSWKRIILITFDQYGVSGHVNHIDTYQAVKCIAQEKHILVESESKTSVAKIPVEAWTLFSERNIVAKYVPIMFWILLFFSLFLAVPTMYDDSNGKRRTYRLFEPTLNWRAMTTHQSQFVWYRRFFVVFSCYTYVNQLERITVSEKEKEK